MDGKYKVVDGNKAVADVAYAFSELAVIYPITPASPIGEIVDEWAVQNKKNLFGDVIKVAEMQSEGGASGSVHGALSAGSLTTTFTASQGLMLMLPNMFKIAGEMLPTVFHVASRSLAYQSLSIFGDHSDVMATRGTGFAIISSSSVQECQDLAIISHLSTLESKVPFLHFFDGFRTSHEINKIENVSYETMKKMVNNKAIMDFKKYGLNPEHPVAKVGAENPDVYFQGRESVNKYYDQLPGVIEKYMKLFKEKTGREYSLFEYVGNLKAKKIIVSMGSSNETIEETVKYLNKNGEKVGAIKVKLYRPFVVDKFIRKIPETVEKIAVLDRTKEVGSIGEPLYLDVVTAINNSKLVSKIKVIGGRYGLSSKEFTPSMVKAIFDHMDNKAFNGFTVGITDDVTNKSIQVKEKIDIEPKETIRCKFWGLGSDGTVGANKNSIKIIGENTNMDVQAYFSYDSKKSGGITISYLRFGEEKIKAPYLLDHCEFIALHNVSFIGKYDILEGIKEKGIFLLNSEFGKEAFNHLTKDMQETIIKKKIKFYNIDASKIAEEVGLGNRINTIMQTIFFQLTNIIPEEKSIELIKEFVKNSYNKKGHEIVRKNWAGIDKAKEYLEIIEIPNETKEYSKVIRLKDKTEFKRLSKKIKEFAEEVIAPIIKLKGDSIPVSKIPFNGVIPTGTTKLEKREISPEVSSWIPEKCIQCGLCSFVCPHGAIRIKQIKKEDLKNAPKTFKTLKSNTKNNEELQFKVQIYPKDCTGCGLCIKACPVAALKINDVIEEKEKGEVENSEFFDTLPEITTGTNMNTIKGSQLKTTLFEFSGACAGCGETPYIKLVTQLFGDRMIIANATGCSSIYGGTFPTIPYTKNKDGKGPAWANSLFEDNAEYGFGMRLAIDFKRKQLKNKIELYLEDKEVNSLNKLLIDKIKHWNEIDNERVKKIKELIPEYIKKSTGNKNKILKEINELKDYLIEKSIWLIGGDGWAYDIGYGGLDHVMAQGKNINVLVLDTEVYSNTGGQASKATPLGASAKYASNGKETAKKNLGLMMMSYQNVYVASVNLGADRNQLLKAVIEAESYDGPSIIIAYSPCIAHGINMSISQDYGKKASESGYWPLYRYNPKLIEENKNPFIWDSTEKPTIEFKEYILSEIRYNTLKSQFPKRAERLYTEAEQESNNRTEQLKRLRKK